MKSNLLILFTVCIILSCSNDASEQTTNLKKTPKEIASLITDQLLSRQEFMLYNTPDVKALHYAEICTAYGALKLAGKFNDQQTMEKLIVRYDSATPKYITNTENHVDANVHGILPLEIYLQTKKPEYLELGIAFADGQWKDTLPDGLTSQTRYWIDDIYMIGCLQIQAFRATNDTIYLDRATKEIDSYTKKLQQPNGLFFHGADAPFFWGRGNGWVAAGFAELIAVLPESNQYSPSILNAYKKMMKTLLENQDQDGMWHQVIDKPESFKETSSTAMFGFAMTVGVKKGILPKKPYTTAYTKAWNALTSYLNEDGKIREVCVGTGQSKDINYYFDRPRTVGDFHGQAPMLWFADALLME
jgi:unsaturated rhamnogalacturonyl hydrolase